MIHYGLQVRSEWDSGGSRHCTVTGLPGFQLQGTSTKRVSSRNCPPCMGPAVPAQKLHLCRAFLPQQFVTAGANPMAIKHGIDKTCDFLVAKLKEHATPVKGRQDIKVGSNARVQEQGSETGSEASGPLCPCWRGKRKAANRWAPARFNCHIGTWD